jgi:hypothetical protein
MGRPGEKYHHQLLERLGLMIKLGDEIQAVGIIKDGRAEQISPSNAHDWESRAQAVYDELYQRGSGD